MKIEDLKKTGQYQKARENPYAILRVPKTWCVRFDLTPTELLILCEIIHATDNMIKGVYCGSRTGLASIVNSSLPTVDKALRRLEEKGFIRKETIDFTTRNGAERRDKVAYRSTLQRNTLANDKTIEETIERSAAAYAVKHDKI